MVYFGLPVDFEGWVKLLMIRLGEISPFFRCHLGLQPPVYVREKLFIL